MRTPRIVSLLLLLSLSLTVTASCAPTARVVSGGGPTIDEARTEPYNGPRARIAVVRFDNKAAIRSNEIGDGMKEMLTTALFNSNRYIVLERAQLGEVMEEQDLGASGRVKKETAAPIGEIEGAEILVTGAITAFEPNAGGGGGGGLVPLGVGGMSVRKSYLAIDLRLVDAKTSRILAATTVEGSASEGGGGVVGLPGVFGVYAKTPMEKALRLCIQRAVDFVASRTPPNYYRYQ